MVIQTQIRGGAEVIKPAPVLVNQMVGAFDVDLQVRDFPGFGGFPVVISQCDQLSIVGEGVFCVLGLIHVSVSLLVRCSDPFVYPDLTERREGIESADSGRVECYKRFMCRATASEAVGKTDC